MTAKGMFLIDFEASSFSEEDSRPVEVGWVRADLSAAWSAIISPVPEWSDWDLGAEDVHRLFPEHLQRFGLSPLEVASRLNADLAGMQFVADSRWDAVWARRLFSAAPSEPAFEIPGPDSSDEAISASDYFVQFSYCMMRRGVDFTDQEEILDRMLARVGVIEHEALDDALAQALAFQSIEIAAGRALEDEIVAKAKDLRERHGRTPEIRSWTPWGDGT